MEQNTQPTGASKESLWYLDNYILLKDYYDRTISRIAARPGDLWIVGSRPTMTVLFFFCHSRPFSCRIRAFFPLCRIRAWSR